MAFSTIAHKNAGKLSSDPVEYMKRTGQLQSGTYKVLVRYYSNNDPTKLQNDFTVSLRRNGLRREIHGTTSDKMPIVGEKEYVYVTEFSVP